MFTAGSPGANIRQTPSLCCSTAYADLTGWEEKDEVVTFPFVEIRENMIQFDGISYQLVSEDNLKITVDMKQADGSVSQVVIDCRKIDR